MPLSGTAVAEIGIGGLLVYSGIKGYTLADTFQSLAKGTAPSDTETIATAAAAPAATGSTTATAAAGNTGADSSTAAQNQAIGQQLAAAYGWSTGQEWEDLVSLWNQESGWNNLAQNPTSTAYGIAQFLDTTWAAVGGSKTSDASTQISLGLLYIKVRYGDPIAAWAHEEEYGWY